MPVLKEILGNKIIEIEELKTSRKNRLVTGRYGGPSFYDALSGSENLAVIGEIKMKSPSQGVMAEGEDPVRIAETYGRSGVSAISVLTDGKFFGGSFGILKMISGKVKLPLLCKDFIIDRVQVDMALESGASAVLLITEILDDIKLQDLYGYAGSLGLDCLVEAHFRENVERAVKLPSKIIGINNRDIDTLEENPGLALQMAGLIPPGIIKLGLSSCRSRSDAVLMAEEGLDGILVGGALMKSPDRSHAAAEFLNIKRRSREV